MKKLLNPRECRRRRDLRPSTSEAQSSCPAEVTKAKEMLAAKSTVAKAPDVQAPLAGRCASGRAGAAWSVMFRRRAATVRMFRPALARPRVGRAGAAWPECSGSRAVRMCRLRAVRPFRLPRGQDGAGSARPGCRAPRGQDVQAPRGRCSGPRGQMCRRRAVGMFSPASGMRSASGCSGPRGQDVKAPRGPGRSGSRGQDVQAPRSLVGARVTCKLRVARMSGPRGQDVQAPRGQAVQARVVRMFRPRAVRMCRRRVAKDVRSPARSRMYQSPRGQDVQSPRGQDVQSPRGQDVQSPRGQDVQSRAVRMCSPRGQDVQSPRGQDVQSRVVRMCSRRVPPVPPAWQHQAASLIKEAEARAGR